MRIPLVGSTMLVLFALAGSLVAQTPSAQLARTTTYDAALIGPADRLDAARGDTLRLADLIDQARLDNPMLLAARMQADAAQERAPQRGALPNPELFFGLKNRPLDGFGTDQQMTMNVIGAVQRFPWPGNQGFSKEKAEHLAEADSLDAIEAERQLVARLSAVYYRAAYLDRAVRIMDRTRELLRGFLDVAVSRYSVGSAVQQDVLQAQISVARMTEDITVAEQLQVGLFARINALVGRPSNEPVGALELPLALSVLPAAESLVAQAVRQRPALAAADRRVAAADAGYRAARRKLYPDFTFKVEYGQRPQYVDFLTLMVGVEIPLWAGQSDLPLRREMESMRLREESRARDLLNETMARVLELRAEAERARKLAELYRESIVPQARASVESALSAYRVGEVDYMTLVESELILNRYEIQTVSLRAEYYQAVAELTALTGQRPGGTP
jgi:outer membrane protein TolC